jgi:hypothetical protein
MKLRFCPRDGALVPDPRFPRIPGQPVRRVGFAADGSPEQGGTEFDSEDPAVRRLVKLVVRDGALAPADKATAAFCGVNFEAPAQTAKPQKGGE